MTDEPEERIVSVDEAFNAGDLDRAVERARLGFTQSPAWNTKFNVYAPLIVEAFSFGVLSADFWYSGYSAPPKLEEVTNWIAFNVQEMFPQDYAIITLNELESLLAEWMKENPWVRDWNPNPRQNDMTKKFYLNLKAIEAQQRLDSRPFVCLESVTRNAAIMVRDHWKHRLEMRGWNK